MTPPAGTTPADSTPLYVDLDGTLVSLDTLHESLRRMAFRRPWCLPLAAAALRSGRAGFKVRVSELIDLDPKTLPYRTSVLAYIAGARAAGQPTILATAATQRIADAVASHLGIFDRVIASDAGRNRKGRGKLDAIRAEVGDGPFDYAGDSSADLPIFAVARRAIVVCPSSSVRADVGRSFSAFLMLEL